MVTGADNDKDAPHRTPRSSISEVIICRGFATDIGDIGDIGATDMDGDDEIR